MDERELQLLTGQPFSRFQAWASADEIDAKFPTQPTDPVGALAKVSLIIPTFRNATLKQNSLVHELERLDRSSCVSEVILSVAEGADKEYRRLERLTGERKLILVPAEPDLRARSRNLAAGRATHDYLLFMDDDMVLKDWRIADVILSRMIEGGFDAALFPRRVYLRFPILFDEKTVRKSLARWRSSNASFQPDIYDPYVQGSVYRSLCFCFPGCFMMIKKSAFAELGGFPEQYKGWGFEDAHFAVSAVTKLKVLSLFKQVDPLLHIDHPVTPYKADELKHNYDQFLTLTRLGDLESFCSLVFQGRDFPFEAPPDRDLHRASGKALARLLRKQHRIPLRPKQAEKAFDLAAEKLAQQGAPAAPRQVILHGSRATGSARNDSDHDLLVLYHGNSLKEFYVSQGGRTPVEVEFSTFSVFEQFAREPDAWGMQGLFELTKIAKGRWIWGDEAEWNSWRRHILDMACLNGRAYWFCWLAGLQLSGKNEEQVRRVRRALLETLGEFTLPEDVTFVKKFDLRTCRPRLRALMDASFPNWRKETRAARKVFVSQTPEIWRAVQWLCGAR